MKILISLLLSFGVIISGYCQIAPDTTSFEYNLKKGFNENYDGYFDFSGDYIYIRMPLVAKDDNETRKLVADFEKDINNYKNLQIKYTMASNEVLTNNYNSIQQYKQNIIDVVVESVLQVISELEDYRNYTTQAERIEYARHLALLTYQKYREDIFQNSNTMTFNTLLFFLIMNSLKENKEFAKEPNKFDLELLTSFNLIEILDIDVISKTADAYYDADTDSFIFANNKLRQRAMMKLLEKAFQ